MECESVFVPREGNTPSGKQWDEFLQAQSAVLSERTSDGWELVQVLGVETPSSMREASRMGGVLLYFKRG